MGLIDDTLEIESMIARGMAETEMIEGAKRSTLAQLADWTIAADKVLVF